MVAGFLFVDECWTLKKSKYVWNFIKYINLKRILRGEQNEEYRTDNSK